MLYEDLSGYLNQNIYPMHMPGNKRRLSPYPGCPVHLDFTEVPGTDDLHHAKGILRDSMERAAQLLVPTVLFILSMAPPAEIS